MGSSQGLGGGGAGRLGWIFEERRLGEDDVVFFYLGERSSGEVGEIRFFAGSGDLKEIGGMPRW